MKKMLLTLSAALSFTLAFAGITFQVEELSKPEKLLRMTPYEEIYENLILEDANFERFNVRIDSTKKFPDNWIREKVEIPDLKILAHSSGPDSLVTAGYHSFFQGIYQAYADHRPFVLSPDMIWLLICQGFSEHVNANAERLRDMIVSHDGTMTLVVQTENTPLNTESQWTDVFPLFAQQIADNTKDGLADLMTADFSTTTEVTKIASQITLMDAVNEYFEFVIMRMVCGIPEITLEGTTADWRNVLEKTKQLSRYDLEWWTSEIIPLLEEFVRASEGKPDIGHWRNIFKIHSEGRCGTPQTIDGWIVKFFPYDKDGKRNNLEFLKEKTVGASLPSEIVKVPVRHIDIYPDGSVKETGLEFWAGFVGLEQDKETFALTPRIGWMVRVSEGGDQALVQSFKSEGVVHIRAKTVPEELFLVPKLQYLRIDFIGDIVVPDELAEVKIDQLTVTGRITDEERLRIRKLFPEARLRINDDIVPRLPQKAGE